MDSSTEPDILSILYTREDPLTEFEIYYFCEVDFNHIFTLTMLDIWSSEIKNIRLD